MSLEQKLAKYPKLGNRQKREQGICWICKQPAKYKLEIQVNFFRGDDEVVKACEIHKNCLVKP